MLDSMYIGATGMQAQQAHVDAIANNLANVNTPGFKKLRVAFSDLVTGIAGAPASEAGSTSVAAGVRVAGAGRSFEGGELKKTDSALDVAIAGDGFLELAPADGSRTFMRGGPLKVNADGYLASHAGVPLKPGIAIPDSAESIAISSSGRVQVRLPGQATPAEVGQLELVRFANVRGLAAEGGNVYRATEASGEPIAARPGEDGAGAVAQGFLEASNVKLVEEMVDLMVAQRAYEASVKVVQATDDMLALINGLRK